MALPLLTLSACFLYRGIEAETGQSVDSSSSSSGLQGALLARSELGESNKKTSNPFNIIFVTSEVAPYSKTGGLGDVCGALPIALAARGHRVMVVSPRYMNGVSDHIYEAAFDDECRVKINCFGALHEVAFFHEYRQGVDWVWLLRDLRRWILEVLIDSFLLEVALSPSLSATGDGLYAPALDSLASILNYQLST